MTGRFAARARDRGKRDRTHARLLDAAAEAFGRDGIAATSVNAIAQAAEVSNGTFYHHFRDKEEIATAVGFEIARGFAERIDDHLRDVEDAAQRTSYGTRQVVELAASEPSWGLMIARSLWTLPELRRELVRFARADLERGVRDGTFHVDVDDLLVDVFVSMVMTAILLRLSGEAGADAGPRVAELQLRMLGVPAARAKRVAWRELEPLSLGDADPAPGPRASSGSRPRR